jgi:hypothetical protein
MADEANEPEERDEQEAAVLPSRKAMSLIAPEAWASFPPGLGDATGAAPDPVWATRTLVDPQASAAADQGSSRGGHMTDAGSASSQP